MRCTEDEIMGKPESCNLSKIAQLYNLKNELIKPVSFKGGKRKIWFWKHLKQMVLTVGIMCSVFLLDSLVFSVFDATNVLNSRKEKIKSDTVNNGSKAPVLMYDRLLGLASRSLVENEQHSSSLWKEEYRQITSWRPCQNERIELNLLGNPEKSNGYILVSANGGLNQQRVAVCNAVAVASLLNATLVIPKFLYSNVWKDPSQFGDIYQKEYFINIMKDEVRIVKELPPDLESLDFKAIGSLITDSDLPKQATPADYNRIVLPRLLKNGVVHFLGYGNRLGFDPLPSHLQKLRCKCNFHALRFVPEIQKIGALLINRIRKHGAPKNSLHKQLLGNFSAHESSKTRDDTKGSLKYFALHLRFEIDMVAYSRCDFGGGENERKELDNYRTSHFPLLIERLKKSKPISAAELRILGKCPLTPEEAALVLSGLGVNRNTFIYLAGSDIYGGNSRMHPLTTLYPNMITKEDLFAPSELEPFRKFSSKLAAIDFIACAAADVFAMTDTGSQLSSLVNGFRAYYGDGHAPTLRPSKKRLAAILSENNTINWGVFENRIRKMIQESQRVRVRGYGKSIYRHPMCEECMCKH